MSGDQSPPRLDLAFAWRYGHSFGALAPYFEGLRAGRAMATRCPVCAHIWFPPRIVCPEHGAGVEWTALTGEGRVAVATLTTVPLPLTGRGERAWLALIAMEGASNLALGRIHADRPVQPGLCVRLSVDPGRIAHPAQAALYLPAEP